jgi:hypothetical protein
VLDDWLPAPVIVDLVAIAGRVDNVQLETHAVLDDDVRLLVDLGRLADGGLGVEAAFGVDEVGCKERVDEGRLAEAGLA